MIDKSIYSKWFWRVLLGYTTFLLIGSFVVSSNFLYIGYLIFLYAPILIDRIKG